MRRKLLELIHACEIEHQDYIDALGFDAYRARRWEHSDAPDDVYEHGARWLVCFSAARHAREAGFYAEKGKLEWATLTDAD